MVCFVSSTLTAVCAVSPTVSLFEYILWPMETCLSVILLPASAFKRTRPLQGPLSWSLLKACLDPTQSKALIRNEQQVQELILIGLMFPSHV